MSEPPNIDIDLTDSNKTLLSAERFITLFCDGIFV